MGMEMEMLVLVWRRRLRRRTRAMPAKFYAKAGRFRHTTRKRDASATPRESGTRPPPLSHMKVPNSLSVKSQNLSL